MSGPKRYDLEMVGRPYMTSNDLVEHEDGDYHRHDECGRDDLNTMLASAEDKLEASEVECVSLRGKVAGLTVDSVQWEAISTDNLAGWDAAEAKAATLEDRERRLRLLLDRIDDFTFAADTPQDVTAAIREFLETQ